MSERILIRDRIIMKIDAVKLEKGHFRMETRKNLFLIYLFIKSLHVFLGSNGDKNIAPVNKFQR